jgi:hypothetical protein
MNQMFANSAFTPGSIQALAEKGVSTSREIYTRTAALAHESAKALSEIADTAWGSTKLLNEKVVQNVAANIDAAFTAAHGIASAKSLAEISKIQSEYAQQLAVKATEQTKEFVDLSTRAAQHLIEKAQAAAKSFNHRA